MQLHPTNVGDDGFQVRCDRTQWNAVAELCKLACAKHGVAIEEPDFGGDRDGDYVQIKFVESQDEDPVEAIEADLRSGTLTATAPTEPTTRTFMATVNWRGSMHVDPLRTFVDEDEARAYAKTLTGGTPVLYETFTSKPPQEAQGVTGSPVDFAKPPQPRVVRGWGRGAAVAPSHRESPNRDAPGPARGHGHDGGQPQPPDHAVTLRARKRAPGAQPYGGGALGDVRHPHPFRHHRLPHQGLT